MVRWYSSSKVRLLIAVTLAVLPVAAPTAHAQNVNGSLAVAATILPPVARPVTRLTAFSIARDGVAQLETTATIAAPVSQIVMWSVSSSENAFVPVAQAPMRIDASRRGKSDALTPSREMRLRFGLDLGATGSVATDSSTRNVTVRIHYLIVPGT